MSFIEAAAVSVLGGSLTGIVAWFTYLRTLKTRRTTAVIDAGKLELDSRRVESSAYANAQKINDDVVKGLHAELDHLRADLKTERDGRAADNRKHALEILELRSMLAQLQDELNVTRAQLRIPGSTTPTIDSGEAQDG
jgi:uncharacterized small protein (DUF1192 family)